MAYYVAWQKVAGKHKTRRYAVLMEKISVPGGINARTYCYLGKDPVAAIEGLYSGGQLTLEQILSISERNKIPGLAELKEELRREEEHHAQGNLNQAD